jgi:hypothetical protein
VIVQCLESVAANSPQLALAGNEAGAHVFGSEVKSLPLDRAQAIVKAFLGSYSTLRSVICSLTIANENHSLKGAHGRIHFARSTIQACNTLTSRRDCLMPASPTRRQRPPVELIAQPNPPSRTRGTNGNRRDQ